MKLILDALLSSKRFVFADLKLHLIPKMNSVSLMGYVELKKYTPLSEEDGGEKAAWEGGYAKQIRNALREVANSPVGEPAGTNGVVSVLAEVRNRPSNHLGKNAAFEFSLTQRFDSGARLAMDAARLEKSGAISELYYPVDPAWVRKQTGEHGPHEHGELGHAH